MVSTGASTRLRISAVMLYICSQLAGGSTLTLPLGPEMRFAGCRFPFLIFGLPSSSSSSSSSSSIFGALRVVRRLAGSVFISFLTATVVLLLLFRFPSEADSLYSLDASLCGLEGGDDSSDPLLEGLGVSLLASAELSLYWCWFWKPRSERRSEFVLLLGVDVASTMRAVSRDNLDVRIAVLVICMCTLDLLCLRDESACL
jgi:hypothetical protein